MPEAGHLPNGGEKGAASVEEICAATWEALYKFIYYKVQNREEAQDFTQETYVKAISYLQRGHVPPEKYAGFLQAVALNVIRDAWRQKKRRGGKVDIDQLAPEETATEDPTKHSARRMLIEAALGQLNDEQRTVVELRILQGYSVAETARVLRKKEAAIRVMQYRALQTLGKILKTNGYEEE